MIVPPVIVIFALDIQSPYIGIFLQIPAYLLLFAIHKQIWPYVKKQLQQKINLSKKLILIYLACFMLLFTLTTLYSQFMKADDYQKQQNNLQPDTLAQSEGFALLTILYYLCLIIFIPLLEELFFRGFLYRYIAERKGWITGLLVSSLLFGLLHTDAFMFAFSLSTISILLLRYTGSLRAPIYFHSIWNAINLFLMTL